MRQQSRFRQYLGARQLGPVVVSSEGRGVPGFDAVAGLCKLKLYNTLMTHDKKKCWLDALDIQPQIMDIATNANIPMTHRHVDISIWLRHEAVGKTPNTRLA